MFTEKDVVEFQKTIDGLSEETTDTEAIRLSIRKWELIKAGLIEERGDNNCALCLTNVHSCVSCPVYKKTGQGYCSGTPYMDYDCFSSDREEQAEAEIVFLKNLLC